MSYRLSKRSLSRLDGVHPDLAKVVKRAIQITSQDFFVGEGLRSKERQRELVRAGMSRTMNSRHLTGHAVDLHPYPYKGDHDFDGIPNSDDWDAYKPIVVAMQRASEELNIPLDHGWDWGWDAPHHQLPWSDYRV